MVRRGWVLIATLGLGALVCVALAATGQAPTFAALASPTQLLMSVLVPLTGVLLAHEARAAGPCRPVGPMFLAATGHAAGAGLAGFALCLVVALAAGVALGGPAAVAVVGLGGIAVQVTAQLVGTGLGLLVRRRLVAFLGTIVLPLGSWAVLGWIEPLAWLRAWVTPFGVLPRLLDSPTLRDLVAWFVVLVLWGGVLNGIGVIRSRRRSASTLGR